MKPSYPAAWRLLALSLLLGGCAIHTEPDSRIGLAQSIDQGQVQTDAELAQTAGIRVDGRWWQVYGDARLNALVEQALANNVDLKQAAINVNKALYQANILGADLVPDFNSNLSAGHSRNLDTGHSSRSYSSQLGLSYELDLWRRLNAAASAQIWEHRASEEDLAAARLTVANNVADAYFQIAYLNQSVRLAEQSLEQYREILRITESKYRHGKVSSIEPTQARQALAGAENSLLSLRQNREEALATLRNLLNLRPGQATDWDAQQFVLAEGGQVDLDVPIGALANRPDLLAAEARLQSAAKSQLAQYRSWYPRITLSAALSSSSDRAGNLFEVPFLGGSIGLSLPFLNWPTLRWQDRTAEANFESAKLGFEKALTTALNEVNSNYQQYRSGRASLANLQERYRLDQENSRYYRVRYQYGRNELKDWLSALNNEYASAQNLLNARYSALRYESMVYKAMAGRYRHDSGAR